VQRKIDYDYDYDYDYDNDNDNERSHRRAFRAFRLLAR